MTSGTVVYGLDNDYGKSADGILKIFQIFFGLLGWALLAALPYHEEIFVQGHTGVFHAALAILVIVWLITIFTYIFRFAGWCSENKTVMQMIATKGKLERFVEVRLFYFRVIDTKSYMLHIHDYWWCSIGQ